MEWLLTHTKEQLLIHASDSAPYHSRMGKSKKEGEEGVRQKWERGKLEREFLKRLERLNTQGFNHQNASLLSNNYG